MVHVVHEHQRSPAIASSPFGSLRAGEVIRAVMPEGGLYLLHGLWVAGPPLGSPFGSFSRAPSGCGLRTRFAPTRVEDGGWNAGPERNGLIETA